MKTSNQTGPHRLSIDRVIGNVVLMGLITISLELGATAESTFGPFGVSRWMPEDGLPAESINAILQSSDGYIWLGTDDGLARFDGVHFKVFDTRTTSEFRNNRVGAVIQDQSGTIWVGTKGGGLLSYHDGRFTPYGPEAGLENEQVKALCEDRAGTLWIGTDGGGLYWKIEDRFEPHPSKALEAVIFVNGLLTDREGSVWVGHHDGLCRITGDQVRHFTRAELLGQNRVISLYEDSTGRIWIGTATGLLRFDEDRFTALRLPDQPANVFSVRESADGRIWVGTLFGLLLVEEERLISAAPHGARLGETITSMWSDHEGSLWVGTMTSGIHLFKPAKFTVFTQDQGLPHDVITSVSAASDGTLYFGTRGGVARLRDGQISTFTRRDGLAEDFVLTVTAAPDGSVWMIPRLGGVHRFVNGEVKPLPESLGLPVTGIWATYLDRSGALWIGWFRGLIRFHEGVVTHYNANNSALSHDDVRAICEDKEGTLWIGTSYGLNRLRDGNITPLTRIGDHELGVVLALHTDEDNTLWIGTIDRGLFRLSDGAITRYSTKEGLHDDCLYFILEDDRQQLWFGGTRGIWQTSRIELNRFAEGHVPRITSTVYGMADGLQSPICTGTLQPVAAKTSDGRLWFATTKGVAVIDPARIPRNPHPPPVIIEGLVLDGIAMPPRDGMTIGVGRSRLEIHYTGLSYIVPNQVRFRYRLEGFDTGWIDAGHNRVAHYTRLPPGQYRFHVIAANNDQVWNKAGATLTMMVPPLFWQTAWFAGLILLGLVGLAAVIYQSRIGRLRREHALQAAFSRRLIRSQESERQRIAAGLHNGLGQNLLVIKNLAVLGQSAMSDTGRIAKALDEISGIASQSIQETRQIAHNLRPFQLDELGLTKALIGITGKIAHSTGISVASNIDELEGALPPELEISLFRIAQECLNNVVKHSNATEVRLVISRTPNTVRFRIEDNGRGFDPALIRQGAASPPGYGLRDMQERIHMMNGQVRIHSQPGDGTRIEIDIPAGNSNGSHGQ
jgi:ligand-binding sensor domain-containing protein/signal transduction histidine kinase